MITLRTRPSLLLAGVALTALLGGCGGDATDAEDTPASASAEPSPTATATMPAGTGPRVTVTPLPTRGAGFPPEAVAVHGTKFHAVFLAVAPSLDDPKLVVAHQKANALGYQGGIGEIDCTQGAREGLDLKPDAEYGATSIFFETKKHAERFVDAYDGAVVGTAHITAGCMD